jgi:hypothetical protein
MPGARATMARRIHIALCYGGGSRLDPCTFKNDIEQLILIIYETHIR